MKFSNVIYTLTVLFLIINIVVINLAKPDNAQLLLNLGFIKSINPNTTIKLAIFALCFSLVTAILLILSFILLIKNLWFTDYKKQFYKNINKN